MQDENLDENPVNDTSEKTEDRIDKLLSKYVSVWIWSILFGTSIGLTYTFINYRPSDRWGPLNILLIVLLVLGFYSAMMALVYQFHYLLSFIIPTFFSEKFDPEENTKLSVIKLRKSVSFIILALIVRVIMVLVELVYSSLMTGI